MHQDNEENDCNSSWSLLLSFIKKMVVKMVQMAHCTVFFSVINVVKCQSTINQSAFVYLFLFVLQEGRKEKQNVALFSSHHPYK